MKRMNKNVVIAAFLALFLGIGNSCADLEVENLMAPDREEALATASDLISLLEGGYDTGFWALTTWRAAHIDNLADQGTNTNAWSGYWFFAQEPRNRFPNATTWSDIYNIPGEDLSDYIMVVMGDHYTLYYYTGVGDRQELWSAERMRQKKA